MFEAQRNAIVAGTATDSLHLLGNELVSLQSYLNSMGTQAALLAGWFALWFCN